MKSKLQLKCQYICSPFQAYTFVKIYFYPKQEENIAIITTAIVETTTKLCPSLKEEAEEVAASYRTLLNLYGRCHRAFNSKHSMTDEDISQLGEFLYMFLLL